MKAILTFWRRDLNVRKGTAYPKRIIRVFKKIVKADMYNMEPFDFSSDN